MYIDKLAAKTNEFKKEAEEGEDLLNKRIVEHEGAEYDEYLPPKDMAAGVEYGTTTKVLRTEDVGQFKCKFVGVPKEHNTTYGTDNADVVMLQEALDKDKIFTGRLVQMAPNKYQTHTGIQGTVLGQHGKEYFWAGYNPNSDPFAAPTLDAAKQEAEERLAKWDVQIIEWL